MTAVLIAAIALPMVIGILIPWARIMRRKAQLSRAEKVLMSRPAFLACGLGLMLIGPVLLLDAQLFKQGASTTEGRVTEPIVHEDEEGTSYYPVVTFSVGGQTMTHQSDFSVSSKEFPVGKTVTVYYHPADPERARIEEDFRSGRLIGMVQGITGMATLTIGLLLPGLVRRFSRRRYPESNAGSDNV